MPFCELGKYQNTANGVKIFYKTYGNGPIKVLMIIRVAGTHDSWNPQVEGLLAGTTKPNDNDQNGMQVCVFDNRGMGRSSVPKNKSDYTTKIMAADAISLMDHLGWNKAHVFGHSMGGMIACKLAATYPNRVLSLALLNVTGGGYECFPKIDGLTLSIAMRFLRAKTPEQRAAVDLDTHYSQEYLEEYVGLETRRDILYQLEENCNLFVILKVKMTYYPIIIIGDATNSCPKGISASGMQSNHGFDGQINACWTHKVSKTELQVIHEEGFLISIIHGRHDVIAQLSHAQRLAEKLYPLARMVELPGGHLVSHERTKEVNEALLDLIRASETKTSPYDWTNLSPNSSSCWTTSWSSSSRSNSETESSNPAINDGNAGKLRLIMLYVFGLFVVLYVFGLFVVAFEYIKRGLIRLKPVRVGPALT